MNKQSWTGYNVVELGISLELQLPAALDFISMLFNGCRESERFEEALHSSSLSWPYSWSGVGELLLPSLDYLRCPFAYRT